MVTMVVLILGLQSSNSAMGGLTSFSIGGFKSMKSCEKKISEVVEKTQKERPKVSNIMGQEDEKEIKAFCVEAK